MVVTTSSIIVTLFTLAIVSLLSITKAPRRFCRRAVTEGCMDCAGVWRDLRSTRLQQRIPSSRDSCRVNIPGLIEPSATEAPIGHGYRDEQISLQVIEFQGHEFGETHPDVQSLPMLETIDQFPHRRVVGEERSTRIHGELDSNTLSAAAVTQSFRGKG